MPLNQSSDFFWTPTSVEGGSEYTVSLRGKAPFLLGGCKGVDDCCTTSNKCGNNEGDCDYNVDCLDGHICGHNNCVGSLFFDYGDDCCVDASKITLWQR